MKVVCLRPLARAPDHGRWPSSSHGRRSSPASRWQRQEKAWIVRSATRSTATRPMRHPGVPTGGTGHVSTGNGRTPGVSMVVADAPCRRRPRGRARPARCRLVGAGARQDAHPRDRGAARDRPLRSRARPRPPASLAAHELHRQPRHRQDHGRPAHGRDPPPPRLPPRSPRSSRSRATTSSGQYVGHTAPKTREVLKRARGGALFIDEAYYLYRPENERDYGQEAIEILLQVMETEREDLVVVLAGYRDRMETFFRSNPGMGSRVAHHIHFPDFDVRRADRDRGPDAPPAGLRAHARGRARHCGAYVERRVRRPRFAQRGAASATPSSARACARPAGSTSAATRWTAATW